MDRALLSNNLERKTKIVRHFTHVGFLTHWESISLEYLKHLSRPPNSGLVTWSRRLKQEPGIQVFKIFKSYFRKFAQIKTVCKYALYTEYSKNIGTTIVAIGAFSMCSYRKVLNVNVGRSSVFGVYVVE